MKKCYAWLLCAGLALPALAARRAVDDAGRSVILPDSIQRIAEGWYAHHSLLVALGAGGQIIATVNREKDRPWMSRVTPELKSAVHAQGAAFSAEALLARHADVVFVARGNPQAEGYRQAGLPVVALSFTDFPGLMRDMTTTAQVLGTPRARERAADYNRYLSATLRQVEQKTAGLAENSRPRVLHIQSLNPLKVDGSGTLIDTWIRLAGGRNAAAGITGNMKEVSPEKALLWQPDVIILGEGCGSLDHSAYAGLFSGLSAVKQHRVFANPAGVFPWDRYGVESALQVSWAAQVLHPALFADVDMVKMTRDFYQRFFDYPLTAAQAQRILHALPPQ